MEKDNKTYTIDEAIKNLKLGKKPSFDATVELHINLDIDPKKTDQMIRFTTVLPNGTGKTLRVAAMGSGPVANADLEIKESDLKKIETGELKPGRDFDVIVAEPSQMPKLAKVAKILGPAGVMPNPKTGTVSDNLKEAIEQIKKGKIEIRTEQDHPIIHTVIGKISFDDKKLVENFEEIISSIKHNRPQKAKPEFIKNVFVSSTMGRSYKVEF